jgi:hypothetical protein
MYLPKYALWKLAVYFKMTRTWDTHMWVRTTREVENRENEHGAEAAAGERTAGSERA